MRSILSFLSIIAFSSVTHAATSPDDFPTATQVRESITKSLGFVEKKGVAWLDNSKCIACHHGAEMVWALNEAKHAGISIDPMKLDALSKRVAGIYQKDVPGHQTKITFAFPSFNFLPRIKKSGWVESTYMTMSQYGVDSADKETIAWKKSAKALILAGQRADGSWKYAGQGLDRPDGQNDEVTTLWALMALPYGPEADAADTAAREKANAWLKKIKPGPSIDSIALRLALEARFGDPTRAAALRDELITRQNSDGSFTWAEKHPADAFGTGEVLYVLSIAGVKSDAPAIRKAWKFLLSTQKPDGSWACNTRKPKGDSKISTYWGTTWAVIGLSHSLPQGSQSAAAR